MLLSQCMLKNEKKTLLVWKKKQNSATSCSFLSHWRGFFFWQWDDKMLSLMKQRLCKAVQNIVFPLTRIETFFTSDATPGLAFAVGFLQAPRSVGISTGFGLSGSCCPASFVACGSGTWDRRNFYFRCAQSSRRPTTQHCGNLLPPPPDEWKYTKPWAELENNHS